MLCAVWCGWAVDVIACWVATKSKGDKTCQKKKERDKRKHQQDKKKSKLSQKRQNMTIKEMSKTFPLINILLQLGVLSFPCQQLPILRFHFFLQRRCGLSSFVQLSRQASHLFCLVSKKIEERRKCHFFVGFLELFFKRGNPLVVSTFFND